MEGGLVDVEETAGGGKNASVEGKVEGAETAGIGLTNEEGRRSGKVGGEGERGESRASNDGVVGEIKCGGERPRGGTENPEGRVVRRKV